MDELVNYSDSDSAEDSCSTSGQSKTNDLSVNSSSHIVYNPLHDDVNDGDVGDMQGEDFFNLKEADDKGDFWTSTIHDNDILLPYPVANVKINQEEKNENISWRHQHHHHGKDDFSHKRREKAQEILNDDKNKFYISHVIDHRTLGIHQYNDIIIYPRLSLQWPYLALYGPLLTSWKQSMHSSQCISSHILIWKLPFDDSASKATCTPICSYHIHRNHEVTSSSSSLSSSSACSRRDYYCWMKFCSAETDPQCLQVVTATSKGFIEIWDVQQDKRIREFDVSSQTGPLLRCAALPSTAYPACLLTSGMSGVISLWDLRVSSTLQRPQLKFSHSELKASIADLLWLNEHHFSSCSDTVDRNNCEHNVGVWDIRFTKPISHQLYQERWGCNRMALKPITYPNEHVRFAVQSQGDTIIEISGRNMKRSTSLTAVSCNRLSYHLEKCWRYEGHQLQGHPFGLAYNPSGTLLASGSWSQSSPVLWETPRRRHSSSSYALMTTAMKRLPEIPNSPSSSVTDVVWVPNQFVSNGCDCLIAVQLNGSIIVYNS
ncbi:unnamed protein product [Trichobilharzia szidati]|nr:unnamed protein product [Trichobilharzia szidati]